MDIFVDTETTGLGHIVKREDAVVEVGLAYRNSPAVITTWEGKMWPGERFFEEGRAAKALEVNHLELEDLRAQPPPLFVWGQFTSELMHAKATRILCWNNAFDEPFIRLEPILSAWLDANDITFHCAMLEIAQAHGRTRVSLQAMCAAYGVPRDDSKAHRAAYDAELTLHVYEAFKARGPVPL